MTDELKAKIEKVRERLAHQKAMQTVVEDVAEKMGMPADMVPTIRIGNEQDGKMIHCKCLHERIAALEKENEELRNPPCFTLTSAEDALNVLRKTAANHRGNLIMPFQRPQPLYASLLDCKPGDVLVLKFQAGNAAARSQCEETAKVIQERTRCFVVAMPSDMSLEKKE